LPIAILNLSKLFLILSRSKNIYFDLFKIKTDLKEFSRHGGLDPLIQHCNLEINQEKINQMKIYRIIAVSGK